MFNLASNMKLTRRVFALALISGLAAIVLLLVSSAWSDHRSRYNNAEKLLVASLEVEAASLGRQQDLAENADFSALFERLTALFHPESIAVVDSTGQFIAHSDAAKIGQTMRPRSGKVNLVGNVSCRETTRASGRMVKEYFLPVRQGERDSCKLLMAVLQRKRWSFVPDCVARIPLALLGAFSLVTIGSGLAARQSRPLGNVEFQLSRLAIAPGDTSQINISPVDGDESIIEGWNQLVSERNRGYENRMGTRVQSALEVLKRRKVEEAVDEMPEGVAVSDEDGNLLYANAAFVAQVPAATAGEEVAGESLASLLRLDMSSEEERLLLDPQQSHRPVVVELERNIAGQSRCTRIARHPIRDSGVLTDSHIWCLRDLTQQKIAEGAQTEFFDAVTHEFRTPLTNIMAYAEALATFEQVDTEQQKEFCNTITSEAGRLSRFIDDLLDISSMEAGVVSLQKSITDMERLIGECADKIRSQLAKQDLKFNIVVPAKLPKLTIDKDKIATTVVNMLGNAAKYTPSGGEVTLRVRVTKEHFFIEVEDTGIGIAEDEKARVFDRFFRSEDSRVCEITGTGLGLALAYEVARLHGGSLTVESELNNGSQFSLGLPL